MTKVTYDLQRFVDAQNEQGTYQRALEELRAGLKTSHWMWFVFPQRAGLGRSETSQRYAIDSAQEARAYLEHPLLGRRLVESAEALLIHRDTTASKILGEIDALKLHSSMTLFAAIAPEQPVFQRVLDRFYAGEPDPAGCFAAGEP
jgi:uncharacterized protein (DUF1810 family)